VATTRPETMLGDTAIAVNPKDERYKNLVGEKVILPLVEKEIPIIADYLVDPKFGTGAVKVTPAHDFLDYEISLKHKLSLVKVIDENGKMTGQIPKNYLGLNTFEAREKIIEDLKSKGLLEKTQDYEISLPKCDRCGEKIEVIPSWQWFLRMKDLTKKVEKEIKKGKIKFHPKRFEKILLNWLSNIKDWCISRQIWWGHKIPLEGEEAVLDTWFSSALWPFAPLGWPRKTKDLKRFYPSDVLVTGRDIINIWVARMIFSGLEFMKKIPFKNVIINPTVLTKEGKRMSKSLGTGIDPMILVKKYGADATRFGLCWQLTGVQDIRFLEDNLLMGKKFCNKIWNASRFVIINCQNLKFENPPKVKISNSSLTPKDKKILKSLNNTIKSVTQNLENFNFGKAAQQIYRFFWHDFCDQYIEASKLQISNPKIKNQTLKILLYVLLNSLKILHPFVPFITEEIYQLLPIKNKKRFLMIEEWPYSK
jgi:valyl-tRNA synthetase